MGTFVRSGREINIGYSRCCVERFQTSQGLIDAISRKDDLSTGSSSSIRSDGHSQVLTVCAMWYRNIANIVQYTRIKRGWKALVDCSISVGQAE